MSIYLGTQQISKIYLGTQEVSTVYFNNNIVFQNVETVRLQGSFIGYFGDNGMGIQWYEVSGKNPTYDYSSYKQVIFIDITYDGDIQDNNSHFIYVTSNGTGNSSGLGASFTWPNVTEIRFTFGGEPIFYEDKYQLDTQYTFYFYLWYNVIR